MFDVSYEFIKCWDKVINEEKRTKYYKWSDDQFKLNPRFYYVEFNIVTGKKKYFRKKWYKWFSKKIVVVYCMPIKKMKPSNIPNYKRSEKK